MTGTTLTLDWEDWFSINIAITLATAMARHFVGELNRRGLRRVDRVQPAALDALRSWLQGLAAP